MSIKQPALQSTKDYSKFELCQFNRSVEKTKHLERSMHKHGFIAAYPIHVSRGEKGILQIKAGHHRFEVAQKLGIPVYYVVSGDDATIHELEKATTTWKQKDYLASFVRCGLPDYVKVKEFHERTGITLGVCVSMLAGEAGVSQNKADKFKSGQYRVTDEGLEHAEAVADVVRFCGDLGLRAADSIFVQSVSRCMFVEEFSPEIFKRRVETNQAMMRPCRSVAEQTELFEHVYNKAAHASTRLPLAFLTRQAMIGRNAVSGGRKAKR